MLTRIVLTVFLLCALFADNIFSQVTQEWVARYNAAANSRDEGYSVAVDAQGNVYVTGLSIENGVNRDYLTIKYNPSGIQQWYARYNGPANGIDEAYFIAVDGLGNVYVTGHSRGSGTIDDYATVKYNPAGVQQWVQRYNGPGNSDDWANSLSVDDFGNVYVTGDSGGDYATIKYNTTGVQEWVQRYNGPVNGFDIATSITIDSSGNVYVTGWSLGLGNNTDYDYATIKYNSAGVQQWIQRYNSAANSVDEAYSIDVDGSGNVYVTGWCRSGAIEDYLTIKYNSGGVLQWVHTYNGPGNGYDRAHSIAVDGLGNAYVTGVSTGNGTSYDYATIKYNVSGDTAWVRRYNGPANSGDEANSIIADRSGNVYVTGSSIGSGAAQDYVTIRYNSDGVQEWVQRYNGPGNASDIPYSIAMDSSENIYVTGWSWGSGTMSDFATVKYSKSIGIQPISIETPGQFSLSQNYPNPFNPVTKIKFAVPKVSFTKLVIYDVLGREVNILVSEQLRAGTYEVSFDGTNYPSGIYYYKLSGGDYSENRKMILIK